MIKQFENFNKKLFTENTIYNLILVVTKTCMQLYYLFQILVTTKICPQLKDLLVITTYHPQQLNLFNCRINMATTIASRTNSHVFSYGRNCAI